MPLEQTDAIVLRTVEFSETSLIVTLLTRDHGKIGVLAKGARRPKGAFEGSLDLLAVCRVVILKKTSAALDLVTESKLQRRFRAAEKRELPVLDRLQRLYAGYYLAELVARWLDDNDRDPQFYDLLLNTLQRVDGDADLATTISFFELQLLRLLGHVPETERCVECGNAPTPAPRFPFGFQAGGVLCQDCRPKHGATIWIRPSVRDSILAMGAVEANFPEPLEASIYGELRPLLNRFITGILGQPLRTQALLPSSVDTVPRALASPL